MANSYDRMVEESKKPWCWYCGRRPWQSPPDWYGPFLIERAHIVNKPRAKDVRAVILLCSACHKYSHGERFAWYSLPKLELPGMLWIKQAFDVVDMEFLQARSIRLLPEPELPFLTESHLLAALLGDFSKIRA